MTRKNITISVHVHTCTVMKYMTLVVTYLFILFCIGLVIPVENRIALGACGMSGFKCLMTSLHLGGRGVTWIGTLSGRLG